MERKKNSISFFIPPKLKKTQLHKVENPTSFKYWKVINDKLSTSLYQEIRKLRMTNFHQYSSFVLGKEGITAIPGSGGSHKGIIVWLQSLHCRQASHVKFYLDLYSF